MTDPSDPNASERPDAIKVVEAGARSLAKRLRAAPAQTNRLALGAGVTVIVAGVALLWIANSAVPRPDSAPPIQQSPVPTTVMVIVPGSAEPQTSFACGEGFYHGSDFPFVSTIAVVIPPMCETRWFTRPYWASDFRSEANTPGVQIEQRADSGVVTGIRFTNQSSVAARVFIRLR